MKSKIRIMLLGIVLMLFGIYIRNIYIGCLYNSFIEAIWVVFSIIGIVIFLYGFLSVEKQDDLIEKIYDILSEQKRKEEKRVICQKCGEKYTEGYNSCPWCGHKSKDI